MKNTLIISLVHLNSPELGQAWQELFEFEENVKVIESDIFSLDWDAIVSPGNSFGFMDGGLDLQISKVLGWQIQKDLQDRIKQNPMSELLVGQAEIIRIENSKKFVICAPTMRIPTNDLISNSVNAYLAMKAILLKAIEHDEINSIAISGLCTGTGGMNPKVAARQMYQAYLEVYCGSNVDFQTYIDARNHHQRLNPKNQV